MSMSLESLVMREVNNSLNVGHSTNFPPNLGMASSGSLAALLAITSAGESCEEDELGWDALARLMRRRSERLIAATSLVSRASRPVAKYSWSKHFTGQNSSRCACSERNVACSSSTPSRCDCTSMRVVDFMSAGTSDCKSCRALNRQPWERAFHNEHCTDFHTNPARRTKMFAKGIAMSVRCRLGYVRSHNALRWVKSLEVFIIKTLVERA